MVSNAASIIMNAGSKYAGCRAAWCPVHSMYLSHIQAGRPLFIDTDACHVQAQRRVAQKQHRRPASRVSEGTTSSDQPLTSHRRCANHYVAGTATSPLAAATPSSAAPRTQAFCRLQRTIGPFALCLSKLRGPYKAYDSQTSQRRLLCRCAPPASYMKVMWLTSGVVRRSRRCLARPRCSAACILPPTCQRTVAAIVVAQPTRCHGMFGKRRPCLYICSDHTSGPGVLIAYLPHNETPVGAVQLRERRAVPARPLHADCHHLHNPLSHQQQVIAPFAMSHCRFLV